MNREQEYRQLANNMFQRAVNEESAQLIAQWEILGRRYMELSRQEPKSTESDPAYDPIQNELLKN